MEFSINVRLHNIERVYERQSYTFMMMVGDIGGFNGAVIVIPTLFMSYYNSLMYQYEVTSEIPIKKKRSRKQKKFEHHD